MKEIIFAFFRDVCPILSSKVYFLKLFVLKLSCLISLKLLLAKKKLILKPKERNTYIDTVENTFLRYLDTYLKL